MAGLFYKSDLLEADAGTEIMLTGDEAKHAITVRRLKVGDELVLTNGTGLTATGKIADISTRPAQLALSNVNYEQKKLEKLIHLASALPKGDRLRTMLDMATQLGMTEFTPINFERSVSKKGKNSIERWQRICLEAMKQCRRVWLPKINPTSDLNEFLSSLSKDVRVVVASQYGKKLPEIKKNIQVVILIGPEGGFTDDELQLIKNVDAIELCLNDSILRTETAAITAVSVVAENFR